MELDSGDTRVLVLENCWHYAFDIQILVTARQRVAPQMVSKGCARFFEQRPDGLLDAPRSGAPRTIDDVRVDAVIARTLERVPRVQQDSVPFAQPYRALLRAAQAVAPHRHPLRPQTSQLPVLLVPGLADPMGFLNVDSA